MVRAMVEAFSVGQGRVRAQFEGGLDAYIVISLALCRQ